MKRALIALAALAVACATARAPEKSAPPPASARQAQAVVPCDDLARLRDEAVQHPEWVAPETPAALAGWIPGTPVSPERRAAVTALARTWVRACAVAESVALTKQLVAFETVSAEQPAADGPAFVAMAGFLERWSENHGFVFARFGANDAWEIRSKPGPAVLSFVMHGDVVPVHEEGQVVAPGAIPPGWKRPPFLAQLEGDQLYGRGTEDDKGPIAAALVSMRALKRFGLEPEQAVIAVIGTGEEHDWKGMTAYAQKTPKPTHVVSVDANFPVVAAESGFVAWELELPFTPARGPRCTPAVDVRAGQFLTQVPGEAALVLQPQKDETIEALRARVEQAALTAIHPGVHAVSTISGGERHTREVVSDSGERLPFEVELEVRGGELGDALVVRALGESVHSSVADEGHNALWALSELSGPLGLCPGGVKTMLTLVREQFAGDFWGERLGLAYAHPFMGRLLVVPTVLRNEAGKLRLSVNMRRPEGKSNADFQRSLDEAAARLRQQYDPELVEVKAGRHVGDPALADLGGELVPRLLALYAEHAGAKDPKPVSVRGGTYARLFPGAVSFGPSLPGKPYRGHAPDESIELRSLEILTRALFDLGVNPPAP